MKQVNFFIGTLSSGGAERVVSNLSINLKRNIKKNILLFGKTSKIDYPYNGKIVYLDKSKQKSLLNKFRIMIYRINHIKKIKLNNQKDVMISFLEYPNLINVLTSKYGKTIISVRNHMSTKHKTGIKSKIWNLTIKYLYPKADLIISVSEEIKLDLITNYKINTDKIKVIYNSYDIKDIEQKKEELIEKEYVKIFENPVIITAGRLNKQKGHWHLIRSFSKVKESIPNAQLVILGEGNLELYLKDLADELNLKNDIHFIGFQKNPFKFISRSKIFIMTSIHEGFPNAMAEAMACGIPVMSSDCLSGPREILAPEEFGPKKIDYQINKKRYGILMPIFDGVRYAAKDILTTEEQVMTEHIISLLKNKELQEYFSSQSKKRIKDFEIKNIIKEWENIL